MSHFFEHDPPYDATVQEMRQLARTNALCPGCTHPFEKHVDGEGCCEDDRALLRPNERVVCSCLLGKSLIVRLFELWDLMR